MGSLLVYWVIETVFILICLFLQTDITSVAWFLLGRLIELTFTMILMSYYQNCLYQSGSQFDRVLSRYKQWHISIPLVIPFPSYLLPMLLGTTIPDTVKIAFTFGPLIRSILGSAYRQYPFWSIGASYQLYLIWLHHRMCPTVDFDLWWSRQHRWIRSCCCNYIPQPDREYGTTQQDYGIPDVIWHRFITKVVQTEGTIA